MDSIEQEIHLAFRYPVHFTRDLFGAANRVLRSIVSASSDPRPANAVFVLDDGVVAAHPELPAAIERYCGTHADVLQSAAPLLIVPGGERVKNGSTHLEAIQHRIHDGRLCRHSYVVAIGGGAVLDVAGYAAATAHRGIRLIRVPTTVLAQDDSAVGVKNGINAFGKKNFFGTFAVPFAVVNDFNFLPTLLDRDWLGGVSEAVKAALIRDAAFFDEIERLAPRLVARDQAAMEVVVRRSAALHLAHIAGGGDPFEAGSSRPLDFGHWAAHKLEQLSDHRLRHGEAVAIGIALDSTYACLSGFLAEADWRRIVDLLLALQLPLSAPELAAHLEEPGDPRSVLQGLEEFREHLGGRLTILLLEGIGRPFDAHRVDSGTMMRSIRVLDRVERTRSSADALEGALPAALTREAR